MSVHWILNPLLLVSEHEAGCFNTRLTRASFSCIISSVAYGIALVNTSLTRRYLATRYNLSIHFLCYIYLPNLSTDTMSPTACDSPSPNVSSVIWFSFWLYFSPDCAARLGRVCTLQLILMTIVQTAYWRSAPMLLRTHMMIWTRLFYFFLLLTSFCFFGVSNSVMKRNDMTKRTFLSYLSSFYSSRVWR